jgi:hypothetical protein
VSELLRPEEESLVEARAYMECICVLPIIAAALKNLQDTLCVLLGTPTSSSAQGSHMLASLLSCISGKLCDSVLNTLLLLGIAREVKYSVVGFLACASCSGNVHGFF